MYEDACIEFKKIECHALFFTTNKRWSCEFKSSSSWFQRSLSLPAPGLQGVESASGSRLENSKQLTVLWRLARKCFIPLTLCALVSRLSLCQQTLSFWVLFSFWCGIVSWTQAWFLSSLKVHEKSILLLDLKCRGMVSWHWFHDTSQHWPTQTHSCFVYHSIMFP